MGRSDDIYEMIFLCRRREILMSIEEYIVFDYFFQERLLNMTHDEREKTLEIKKELTKILNECGL